MLHTSGEANVLEVTFDKTIACGGRFTYSSQIDWAPAMATFDPTAHGEDAQHIEGRETFGFGIWKSVYLTAVPAGSAAITHFLPHTFYAGGHPTSILSDGNHSGFELRARVEMWAPAAASGTVQVDVLGLTGASVSMRASVTSGFSNVTIVLPASMTSSARLWHPHGHGEQPRYNVTATFVPNSAGGDTGVVRAAPSVAWRLLGFRHVALVTVNDSDSTVVAKAATQDGSGQFGMFFRVNGAAVYARGGNKVPMDLLDGRMSATSHRRLVQSAAAGNMNLLRVWGGGIWEPRAFLDACDEFGVLLYLDLQFTWGSINVEGAVSDTVRRELVHQISRISHHASIVLIDSCNECGGHGLYDTFAMTTVASVDVSRPVSPGSPSAGGWASGVDRLTARPNGNTLVTGEHGGPGAVSVVSLRFTQSLLDFISYFFIMCFEFWYESESLLHKFPSIHTSTFGSYFQFFQTYFVLSLSLCFIHFFIHFRCVLLVIPCHSKATDPT